MRFSKLIAVGLLLSALPGGFAQVHSVRSKPAKPASAAASEGTAPPAGPPAPEPMDPLGRRTPRGSVLGFLQYAQVGNYTAAADYLQMTKNSRAADGERLASQLHKLLDRDFVGNVGRISDQQEGSIQAGVPPDQERIGTFEVNGEQTEVRLVRVQDPQAGMIWLFSKELLAKVPELYDSIQQSKIESRLPKSLVDSGILAVPLWRLIVFLLVIPLSGAIAWGLVRLFQLLRLFILHLRKREPEARFGKLFVHPIILLLATAIDAIFVRMIGLSLLARHYYSYLVKLALIVAFTWLTLRIINWVSSKLHERPAAQMRAGSSLILLGERVLKVLVVIVGAVAALSSLGVNTSTALAGLGIGGIALGLGAQKTLENVFGGVSVLADKVIRVGDTCQFGDRVGNVEDVSLRSTRIRTVERTELSIPNGALATMNVENLSRRDKILFKSNIGLRYETSPDQLRCVLVGIRQMLYQHPRVETDSARIRFLSLGDTALTLELFCYLVTIDFNEYLAIREDLLLRIMDIVHAAGTAFAFPSRTLYFSKDHGLDRERVEAAEHTVEEWRESNQLPFPDFPPDEIRAMRNTLEYPPKGAATASPPTPPPVVRDSRSRRA